MPVLPAALFALPFIFLILFFFLPVGKVLTGGLSLPGLAKIFGNAYYRKVIGFTIFQALVSTFFSVLLGLPGAYFMANYSFPGKRLVNALSAVPFFLPSILAVLGFVLVFGNNGIVNRFLISLFGGDGPPLKILYSFKAIILAHVFYNFPIVLRLTGKYWSRIGNLEEKAASLLGSSPLRTFFKITLPKIAPSIISSAGLIFIYCFMSFSVILVLGGGPKYSTIEVEIYNLARSSMDTSVIGNLAFVSILFSVGFAIFNVYIQKKMASRVTAAERPGYKKLFIKGEGLKSTLACFYFAVVLALIIGPPLAVIVNSFIAKEGFTAGSHFSLKWYKLIFSGSGGGLGLSGLINTVMISLLAMLCAASVGLIFSYLSNRVVKKSSALEGLMTLPLSVGSVALGVGYLSLSSALPDTPLITLIAIAMAHAVTTYPLVMRGLSAFYQGLSGNIFKAAALAGAGPGKTFLTIDLPLVLKPLLAVSAFAFALSAGEFNASVILSKGKVTTIPVLMYRMIGAYNFNGACAYGTILISLSIILVFALDSNEGLI